MRPSKEAYYLKLARDVAGRSTCMRSRYGSILVNADQIISTGYNGAARGLPNCSDMGKCNREGIPSRTRYELCRSVHAECNTLLHAGRDRAIGGTLYIAGICKDGSDLWGNKVLPCPMCYRVIVNCGVTHVCIRDRPPDTVGEWWATYPVESFAYLDDVGDA
jgi:dCMP deaminase